MNFSIYDDVLMHVVIRSELSSEIRIRGRVIMFVRVIECACAKY